MLSHIVFLVLLSITCVSTTVYQIIDKTQKYEVIDRSLNIVVEMSINLILCGICWRQIKDHKLNSYDCVIAKYRSGEISIKFKARSTSGEISNHSSVSSFESQTEALESDQMNLSPSEDEEFDERARALWRDR